MVSIFYYMVLRIKKKIIKTYEPSFIFENYGGKVSYIDIMWLGYCFFFLIYICLTGRLLSLLYTPHERMHTHTHIDTGRIQ